MEFKAQGFQGRPAIVREGTTHARTVASDDFGFRVVPSCQASFNGAHPTNTLLEFLLVCRSALSVRALLGRTGSYGFGPCLHGEGARGALRVPEQGSIVLQ